MQAALGTMWAHAVNTRLVLMQTQGGCQLCNTSLNSSTALLAGGCRHSRCAPAYRSSPRHPPSTLPSQATVSCMSPSRRRPPAPSSLIASQQQVRPPQLHGIHPCCMPPAACEHCAARWSDHGLPCWMPRCTSCDHGHCASCLQGWRTIHPWHRRGWRRAAWCTRPSPTTSCTSRRRPSRRDERRCTGVQGAPAAKQAGVPAASAAAGLLNCSNCNKPEGETVHRQAWHPSQPVPCLPNPKPLHFERRRAPLVAAGGLLRAVHRCT